jgi:hypothetical protein
MAPLGWASLDLQEVYRVGTPTKTKGDNMPPDCCSTLGVYPSRTGRRAINKKSQGSAIYSGRAAA